MKAVILAAGKGTRMWPLTEDTPKPLLPVAGRPIIEHIMEYLEDRADEIIVVAGYRIEEIEDHFSGRDVKIVEQEEALGTADAALQARKHVEGTTIIMNGDDLYSIPEINNKPSVLVSEAEKPEDFGVMEVKNGLVKGIEEKPEDPESNLVNTGFYVVEEDFFELLEDVEKSSRGEYEITDAVEKYIERRDVEAIKADTWIPCSYPWNLLEASREKLETVERDINGEIDETARIKGEVAVEQGAEIEDHSVIEGPAIIKKDAEIGPHAHIRPGTVIHENVKIGRSEVKNSVVREEAAVPHFNYVGDSYISRNVNLGAGTKTANMRNDSRDTQIEVKGEILDTGREKTGAFIGPGVKTGVNCSINPGMLIGARAATDSNEKIIKNLPSDSLLKDGEIIEDWNRLR